MTDTLSLGPVLDLIERWQQDEYGYHSDKAISEFYALDIPALRALAAAARGAVAETC